MGSKKQKLYIRSIVYTSENRILILCQPVFYRLNHNLKTSLKIILNLEHASLLC